MGDSVVAAGSQEYVAGTPCLLISQWNRKWRKKCGYLLWHFLLPVLAAGTPPPRANSGRVFLSQLNLSGDTVTDIPRSVSPKRF